MYLAQNKDLPEEYRRQLTAFVYEPGWTEGQMSVALLYNERDMAKAVIAQNTESPAEGWRSLYNDFTAARDEILQPAIDALSKGMKQGVDIIPIDENGRGIRVSNNAPWYQEYYKEHGKAPNQAQLRDLAYLLTVGDASAPQVEGWIPTTREAAEAMDAARGELDELNGHIKTLENIKERMMKVDSFEVKGSAGLSPEGYKLYRQIIEMLEKIGGEQKEDKQTKVARMNAMLFAHHADIFAAAMRTQEGKEKYTALDYFKDRFALRYGGTDMRDGFAQSSSARRLKEDMLAWKQKVDDFLAGKLPLHNNVVMRTPLVFDLIGADSTLDIAIDRNILQKLVDKHHFTRQNLLELPKKIADPLFVLRAIDTKTGVEDTQKRIVVIDMEINGATVMVPFVVNTAQGMNKIASAYGRAKSSGQPNDQWYIDRLNQKNLLYINKNRTARWVATRTGAAGRHNAPLTKQSFSKLSIPDETALGKLKKENPGFYQSAWHGSPYDFREFLLEMIGAGEGRQAHGWGLYFAQNREVSERYKEWLKKAKKKAIHTLTYDGESLNEQPSDIQGVLRGFENYYLDLLRGKSAADVLRMMRDEHVRDKEMHEKKRAEFDVPLALYEENPKISVRALLNSVDKYSSPRLTMEAAESSVPSKRRTAGDLVQALKKSRELYDARAHEEESRIRAIDAVDPDKFNLEVQEPVGKLFRVEIPNDDVLLDEQKPFDEQPKFVREKLEEMFSRADTEQLLYVLSKKDSRFDEVYSDYCELLDHEQDEAYAQEIRQRYNHELSRLIGSNTIPQALLRSFASGQEIYKSISDVFSQLRGDKEASLALNEVGIKGITYDGRQDGRCFVVFDDKAISIIEKFNQMLRQEVRGEISKEDGKRIITLFESADESTFMHEMGHMFLMDLDELAKMDEASAKELETVNAWAEWHEGAAEEYKDTDFADEFRDHENAILAAKKSGDAVAEKAALERWRQERFARGFEMYLSEGKAPSAAMRSVFRRFKAFLRKIYNLAKNAGAMPSVEVQAVMARMIATENEITEAKLDERFRPIEKLLGKESVESLLGETEAELYQRWTQEAQEEAEDILRKRVMNDLKKEAREEFNEKVEAERERKRAELESDPVYLAEYAMRQGGSTDVVMNWFPSYATYKKARGKRKTLENELKDYMTEYASKLDEQIMQAHLSDENVARAMQTPKAYHRRLAIESAALRRKERLMRLLGGNAPEEVKKKAVAEVKKAESPTRRGTKQEVRKDIRRLHQMHGYP